MPEEWQRLWYFRHHSYGETFAACVGSSAICMREHDGSQRPPLLHSKSTHYCVAAVSLSYLRQHFMPDCITDTLLYFIVEVAFRGVGPRRHGSAEDHCCNEHCEDGIHS